MLNAVFSVKKYHSFFIAGHSLVPQCCHLMMSHRGPLLFSILKRKASEDNTQVSKAGSKMPQFAQHMMWFFLFN